MQVIELQGGEHPINDGVLVDEPWQTVHNLPYHILRIVKVVHDMAAGHDLMVSIHAIVKPAHAIDVEDLVDSNFLVRTLGNCTIGGI